MHFKKRLKNEMKVNNKNNINYDELLNKVNSYKEENEIIKEDIKSNIFGLKQILKYSLTVCSIFLIIFGSIFFTKRYIAKEENKKIEYLNSVIEDLKNSNESNKTDDNIDKDEPNNPGDSFTGENSNEDIILNLQNQIVVLQQQIDVFSKENVELKEEYSVLLGNLNELKNSLDDVKKLNDSLILQNDFLFNEIKNNNDENYEVEEDSSSNPSYDNSNVSKPVYSFSTGFTIENLLEVSYKVSSIPFVCNKIELNGNDYLLVYASIVIKDDIKYLKFYHKLISNGDVAYKVDYKYLDKIITLDAITSNELLNENFEYLTILKDDFTNKLEITVYNDDFSVTKEYTSDNF
mgnify:CR=1 FL=1